jgi:signal transduction histidine kinase
LDQRNNEVLKQSTHLRDLSYRMMQIQDNERRHIARELHDSAGQLLAGLAINLSSIVQRAKLRAPELAKEAGEGQELVRELSQEIRTTSYLLHPPLLDETGLPGALLWYIQGLNERSELDITLEIPEDFGRLSGEMELVIFRIVQECLTNVHRHSGSKLARIGLSRIGQIVSIEVQDEGKGIAPEKLLEIQSQGAGVGIRGMRERVIRYGGDLTIQSGSWGTKILVRVTCEKP